MLTIRLNGELLQFTEALVLAELVKAQSLIPTQIALVRNGELVARHRWAQIAIQDNDNLEIFAAVAGG